MESCLGRLLFVRAACLAFIGALRDRYPSARWLTSVRALRSVSGAA